MTYTEKRLEEFEKELSKLVIDLVWSATDGGRKITESNFSHFGDPIPEWTALVSKFSTSIHQAEKEMIRRVEVSFVETLRNSRVGVHEKGRIVLFIHEAIASLKTEEIK